MLGFDVSGNSKESFNPIFDPDADPYHHQDLITSKLCLVQLPCKFPPIPPATFCVIRLTCQFVSSANKLTSQTDKFMNAAWASQNLLGGGNK